MRCCPTNDDRARTTQPTCVNHRQFDKERFSEHMKNMKAAGAARIKIEQCVLENWCVLMSGALTRTAVVQSSSEHILFTKSSCSSLQVPVIILYITEPQTVQMPEL